MSCFWTNYEVSLTVSEGQRVNKAINLTNTLCGVEAFSRANSLSGRAGSQHDFFLTLPVKVKRSILNDSVEA